MLGVVPNLNAISLPFKRVEACQTYLDLDILLG